MYIRITEPVRTEDTVEPSMPQEAAPEQQENPNRPSRAAVVAVATTVLLATGSSALALSGLRTAPETTGLAYGSSETAPAPGAPAPQPDGDLFLSPGPYGPQEPSVVRALPQAPQPLAAPAPTATGSSGSGSVSPTLPIASGPSAASSSAGGLGLPALPQLLTAPAPAGNGLALGRGGGGPEPEGGPSLGLPPGLLGGGPDDERSGGQDGERPGRDLLDDNELVGQGRPDEGGDEDRQEPSGPPADRPGSGDDQTPSTEPPGSPEPSRPAPPAPGGDPASVEQMMAQAREQAMAMARERFARELEQRRAAAEQEQRERSAREEQQRREAAQRCNLEDPRPAFEAERDERGRVTVVRGSGFGESCVGRTAQLVLRTADGEVTGTSEITDGRTAKFSLSRPVAPDKITGSSLSAR